MPSFNPPYSLFLCVAVVLIFQIAPVSAFGAGNIGTETLRVISVERTDPEL
jgi:hypothetical protein